MNKEKEERLLDFINGAIRETKPMIVAILNQKGGVGKTTLSVNLSSALKMKRKNVLLVDTDPQGSARDWHARGSGDLLNVVGLDRPTLDKDLKPIMYGF